MIHLYNRTSLNESFNQNAIDAVWQKGQPVQGYDPGTWRKDVCGAWINRSDYGNCNSKYGWEIDHKHPVAKGGKDYLENLQPLQWQNNRHKSDNWPNWSCLFKAV